MRQRLQRIPRLGWLDVDSRTRGGNADDLDVARVGFGSLGAWSMRWCWLRTAGGAKPDEL